MQYSVESIEVQKVLTHILKRPADKSQSFVQSECPGLTSADYIEILSVVRKVLEANLGTSLETNLPKRISRLRFCWKVMRLADNAIRKQKVAYFPGIINFDFLFDYFCKIFPSLIYEKSFLEQLLINLGLEANGTFISIYSSFIKPSRKKKPLNINLVSSKGEIYSANLRRIILWIIRKNRDIYVEPDKEVGINIQFNYLTEHVERELFACCHQNQLKAVPNLVEEIENQINKWLEYNCLDGDSLSTDVEDRIDIVKVFISDNNLKNKIILIEDKDPKESKRIFELESEISEYAENNEKLEKEIERLKKALKTASIKEPEEEKNEASVEKQMDRDLFDYLNLIDSKYSLDVLRSLQLGEGKSVTIKNFLAHFFYSLRKKGLVSYPSEEKFDLSYDQSSLYSCSDFEIAPDTSQVVGIEKKGWALKKNGRLHPIRKAVVKLK